MRLVIDSAFKNKNVMEEIFLLEDNENGEDYQID
jgi:hypothetical protein